MTGGIPRISVLCDTCSTVILQLFAGLTALRRQGRIQLDYNLRPSATTRTYRNPTLWLELTLAGRVLKICFDIADGGVIASPDGLEMADVYFKKSFDPAVVDGLELQLRRKVKPYGLNLFCLGDADKDPARRTFVEQRLRRQAGKPFTADEWSFHIALIVSAAAPRRLPKALWRFLIPRESTFRAQAGDRRRETVVYQVRLFAPETAPKAPGVVEMNEERARLVRALRRQFGSRFVGGIVRTPFAEEHYRDCLTPFPSDQWSYSQLLRTSSIAVSTAGIHGSTSWKVAEYLAAGLCIVTTPFAYQLPTPLVAEEHFLPFSTEDECVAACDRLLSSRDVRRPIEAANLAYFESHVLAERLTARCIDVATQLLD